MTCRARSWSAGAALVDAGRGRVRVLAHPLPRRRLQPAAPRVARRAPRRRRDLDRSTGPRPRRRPGGRPRLPLRDRPGTRPRAGPGRSGGHAGGAGAALPHARRRTRARPRHGRGHHQPRTGTRTHPRGPPRPCRTCSVSFAEAALHGGRTGDAKRGAGGGDPRPPRARRSAGPGPRHEHAQRRAVRASGIRAGQSCPRRRSHCSNRSRPAPTWSQRSPRSLASEMLQGRPEAAISVAQPRAQAGRGARP